MRADEHAPNAGDSNRKYVYWHRELPPFEAEMIGEHVLDESIDNRRDEATDEAWLHGLFTYALYR